MLLYRINQCNGGLESRHTACVRFLLDNFADPFAVDKTSHRNALIYAAAAGRAEVVKRLMDAGCKVMTEEGPVLLRNAIVHDDLGNVR
jgi:ankyrin repeat protein